MLVDTVRPQPTRRTGGDPRRYWEDVSGSGPARRPHQSLWRFAAVTALPVIEPTLFLSQVGSTANVVGYQSVSCGGGSPYAGRYSVVRVAAIGMSIRVQFAADRLCQRWNVPLWVRKSPALIVISYSLPSS